MIRKRSYNSQYDLETIAQRLYAEVKLTPSVEGRTVPRWHQVVSIQLGYALRWSNGCYWLAVKRLRHLVF